MNATIMNSKTINPSIKSHNTFKSALVLLGAALVGFTGSVSAASISGTPHDLSARGWGTTELCKFCHTPHLAQAVSGAPLWNHQTTLATYTLYSSATFQASGSQTQPGATSKLCLSCHDGTVAVDSFANGGVVRAGSQFMPSTNRVGSARSLTSDHPIAFTYNQALVALDPALVTPVATNYVDAAHQIPLYNSKMECASCHSTHDNSFGKFLRTSNAGSALCLKCHIK